jgi:thiamine-phosphate pyrophosphorylase
LTLPRLHLVTTDLILADPHFPRTAAAVLERHGPAVALHVRGPASPGAVVYRVARALSSVAEATGARLLVNDRVDVALALGCGVQASRRSIPAARIRALLGDGVLLGCSAHREEGAVEAEEAGGDLVLLGTIWSTPSHPGRAGAGPDLLRRTVAVAALPILAIGGVTPERAREARRAGAWGVAVIRGVWSTADPAAAAAGYLDAMRLEA